MKKTILMSLVALMAMTMTSCLSMNFGNGSADKTPTQVTQIGQVTTMQAFDVVDNAGAFKVIYEQGPEYSVRVEASEQALKEMTVYVKDHELHISKSVTKPTVEFKNVKLYVTSPDIKRIDLAGSGLFTASQPIHVNHDLNVDIAGSGRVLLVALKCVNSGMEIAGSGNIEIGNMEVTDAKADIAGSGNIVLGTMICIRFNIDIAGSGDVNCDSITANDVNTSIAGSGNVYLKGTINQHAEDIAGSGKVHINEE